MSAESVVYYLNRPLASDPVDETEWLFSALGQFTGAELRELLYIAQERGRHRESGRIGHIVNGFGAVSFRHERSRQLRSPGLAGGSLLISVLIQRPHIGGVEPFRRRRGIIACDVGEVEAETVALGEIIG